jgi:hypothetical protein
VGIIPNSGVVTYLGTRVYDDTPIKKNVHTDDGTFTYSTALIKYNVFPYNRVVLNGGILGERGVCTNLCSRFDGCTIRDGYVW